MKIKKIISIILVILLFILRFITNNQIITNIGGILLLYFILVGNFLFLSKKFDKPFYNTIPLCMIYITLILIIFGYLNLLISGLVLISIIGLLSFIHYSEEFNFKFFLTSELGFFSVLFFLLFVSNYFVNFNVWDEYSYWSAASKNYYLSNSINFSKLNILPQGIYPPNPTILQYFFMKIIGNYRQGFELLTCQMFGFSLLISLFEFAKSNKEKIMISIICLCLPAIFCEQLFYYTIYVDPLLGLITGYGLINLIKDDKDSKISFLLSLILITLTKSSGIMFAFVMVIFYVVKYILDNYKKGNIKTLFKICIKNKFIYMCILVVLISFGGNKIYYKIYPSINNNINYISDNNITISSVGNALKSVVGALTGYEYDDFSESITTSVDHLLMKKYYSHEPFNLSAYNWIIIFLLFFYIMYCINKNKQKDIKNSALSLLIMIIIYILLLEVSYLFMFNVSEAIIHNSAQRYIGSILLPTLFFIIYYFMKQTKHSKFIIGITLIIMLFTPIDAIIKNTVIVGNRNRITMSYLIEEQKISDIITNNVKNSNQLITFNQGGNNHLLKIIYLLGPFNVTNTIVFNKELFELNDMKNKILSYEYILIVTKDDFLQAEFKKIFDEEINDMTLYKNDNGKLIEIKN